jgi:hypothetical protein
MIRTVIIIVLLLGFAVFITQGCESRAGNLSFSSKDLSQQMDVLSIYQNQMGDDIRRNDLNGAEMMLDGMDSVLHEIISTIDNHPNLNKPFSYYHESKLEEPIEGLRKAIQSSNRQEAVNQYKLLVKKCNSCHNLHEVEERAHE